MVVRKDVNSEQLMGVLENPDQPVRQFNKLQSIRKVMISIQSKNKYTKILERAQKAFEAIYKENRMETFEQIIFQMRRTGFQEVTEDMNSSGFKDPKMFFRLLKGITNMQNRALRVEKIMDYEYSDLSLEDALAVYV